MFYEPASSLPPKISMPTTLSAERRSFFPHPFNSFSFQSFVSDVKKDENKQREKWK
jgi:hypothetical protein